MTNRPLSEALARLSEMQSSDHADPGDEEIIAFDWFGQPITMRVEASDRGMGGQERYGDLDLQWEMYYAPPAFHEQAALAASRNWSPVDPMLKGFRRFLKQIAEDTKNCLLRCDDTPLDIIVNDAPADELCGNTVDRRLEVFDDALRGSAFGTYIRVEANPIGSGELHDGSDIWAVRKPKHDAVTVSIGGEPVLMDVYQNISDNEVVKKLRKMLNKGHWTNALDEMSVYS